MNSKSLSFIAFLIATLFLIVAVTLIFLSIQSRNDFVIKNELLKGSSDIFNLFPLVDVSEIRQKNKNNKISIRNKKGVYIESGIVLLKPKCLYFHVSKEQYFKKDQIKYNYNPEEGYIFEIAESPHSHKLVDLCNPPYTYYYMIYGYYILLAINIILQTVVLLLCCVTFCGNMRRKNIPKIIVIISCFNFIISIGILVLTIYNDNNFYVMVGIVSNDVAQKYKLPKSRIDSKALFGSITIIISNITFLGIMIASCCHRLQEIEDSFDMDFINRMRKYEAEEKSNASMKRNSSKMSRSSKSLKYN
uniref:G_PROTEIN_RECEP_F1_2 domain-containing protein n=1 Tax=Parastrongyloides trichosuri TaxID=131310 RepID=A0A0N4Z0A0_PARTI